MHDARIGLRSKFGERDQQRARINGVTSIVLDKTLFLLTPPLFHDFPVNDIAGGPPFVKWRRQTLILRNAYGPIKGHPTHHTGVHERSLPTTHLPDAFIKGLPVFVKPIDEAKYI